MKLIVILFNLFFPIFILSCKNDEQLCKELEGPIALDFRLGMSRKEYIDHREKLIKEKKIYPSPKSKILEGDINLSWEDKAYQSEYDYFNFSHIYFDPTNDDTWDAGFKIAIVPTFSSITGKLVELDLYPRPYSEPISSTKFIGITALIKVFEKKYGGNGSYNKSVYKDTETFYYNQQWSCDNVKIDFNSKVTLYFDKIENFEGMKYDRDLNKQLHDQKPVKVGFPWYTSETSISYIDVKGLSDLTEKRYNDHIRSTDKKKQDAINENKGQSSDF